MPIAKCSKPIWSSIIQTVRFKVQNFETLRLIFGVSYCQDSLKLRLQLLENKRFEEHVKNSDKELEIRLNGATSLQILL